MRLTKHTNYAIRMLMYCASNTEKLSRVSDIAKFYNLPEPFLLKILQSLTKAGYVKSVRGRKGGIRLAKPAQYIGLGEVVRRVEDNFELAECFQAGEAECPLITSCGLSSSLRSALDAFFAVLDEYTIDDLANNQRNLNVLVQLEAATRTPFAPKTKVEGLAET
ncbi:MAG: iron-responsive transcriptional regulator RirA [Pseudomonadota bacterium]